MKLDKIYNADCLGENGLSQLPGDSIDMILADLPYETTACKWDSIIPLEPLWKEYERVLKNNGVILLTGSEPFSSKLVMSNTSWFRYKWIWNKVAGANFMNLDNRPWKTHEEILVFFPTANFTFNPIRTARTQSSLQRDPPGHEVNRNRGNHITKHYNVETNSEINLDKDGKKHPIDIIKISVHGKNRYKINHPTKKPVKLFKYLIKTYTNKSDIVLDNVIGSGTTAVAAKALDRKYIGFEKDSEYYKTAQERVSEIQKELI